MFDFCQVGKLGQKKVWSVLKIKFLMNSLDKGITCCTDNEAGIFVICDTGLH